MNFKNPSVQLILVSLIAAGAILVTSAIFTEASQTVTFIIIAVWWVFFTLYIRRANNKSDDDRSP